VMGSAANGVTQAVSSTRQKPTTSKTSPRSASHAITRWHSIRISASHRAPTVTTSAPNSSAKQPALRAHASAQASGRRQSIRLTSQRSPRRARGRASRTSTSHRRAPKADAPDGRRPRLTDFGSKGRSGASRRESLDGGDPRLLGRIVDSPDQPRLELEVCRAVRSARAGSADREVAAVRMNI
jgi:hypothetical protein